MYSIDIKVSAYIVTRNRSDIVSRAIESVLNQTHQCAEILVIDDASTEDYYPVIFGINNSLVKYTRLDQPMGACFARNFAIKNATGEMIAGLDDDDEWNPKRIEILLKKYLKTYPSLVYSDDWLIGKSFNKKTNKKNYSTLESMKYENVVGNQILTERKKIVEVGMFDTQLKAAQDYDMWFRMIDKFGPGVKAAGLLQNIYVDRDDRISRSSSKFSGYFFFYKKIKPLLNRRQRKYQLLNIKYLCRERISLVILRILFVFSRLKRMIKILLSRVFVSEKNVY